MTDTGTIRICRHTDHAAILAIVNAAAEAYRDVIPGDCWHDPYMSMAELERDIAGGVEFWGYESDGTLIGVMGIQAVEDAKLIRHAYVRPARQRGGIGAALIARLCRKSTGQMLVGTWESASWAINFYLRNGFKLVAPQGTPALLRRYWSISQRQMETSVVLANPPL